jgi:hypothetical protein
MSVRWPDAPHRSLGRLSLLVAATLLIVGCSAHRATSTATGAAGATATAPAGAGAAPTAAAPPAYLVGGDPAGLASSPPTTSQDARDLPEVAAIDTELARLDAALAKAEENLTLIGAGAVTQPKPAVPRPAGARP